MGTVWLANYVTETSLLIKDGGLFQATISR